MHTALRRVDACVSQVETQHDLDIRLFATEETEIDRASIDEIIDFAEIVADIRALSQRRFFGDAPARLERVVLTPDFHKAAGIPVGSVLDARGFVLPKAVGGDIGCGMRLLTTDVQDHELARLDHDQPGRLETILRRIFFEGARDIPLSRDQREGMLRGGMSGLFAARHSGTGVWAHAQPLMTADALKRTHRGGAWEASEAVDLERLGLEGFLKGSGAAFTYDDQIGSIGGGNHFVEIQRVDEIADGATARDWGVAKGHIAIMAHSGSVGIGQIIGKRFTDLARRRYPNGVKHPEHGFFMLPAEDPDGRAYLAAMGAAANFAFANRFFLALMTVRALSEALNREVEARPIYDAPHNLIWREGEDRYIHRKGACPAEGPETEGQTDDAFPYGRPVIVPGSMGSSSHLLRGTGHAGSLCSACHGAGRAKPRGQGRRGDAGELSQLRVVTKVAPEQLRGDLRRKIESAMLEEAPSRYKAVGPVIDTIARAGVASPVAQLWPLLTVKGL
ncbi:MAG: RtcB family protein [Neomegalonema sp.]|nr:RtcB family protein [Neomegalonema sp.]